MVNVATTSSILLITVLVLLSVAHVCECYIPAHKITSLLGAPTVSGLSQYSGYLPVDKGKNLFYWLVEYDDIGQKKPLLIWIGGGPGCSSIGYGLFQEIGPWRVSGADASSLTYQTWGWHQFANVLFIDHPVSTGFSSALAGVNSLEYNDAQAATELLTFVHQFFAAYPSYKGRSTYIGAEHYGAHFAFGLAEMILSNNQMATSGSAVSLKGIIAGNPLVDFDTDVVYGQVEASYELGCINSTLYGILTTCKESLFHGPGISAACQSAVQEAQIQVGPLDVANLLLPYCVSCNEYGAACGGKVTGLLQSFNTYLSGVMSLFQEPTGNSVPATDIVSYTFRTPILNAATRAKAGIQLYPLAVPGPTSVQNPGCIDLWVYRYLNTAQVKADIHANTTEFTLCTLASSPLKYSSTDAKTSQVGVIKSLIASGIYIWLYSGDADLQIPMHGTRKTVHDMNLNLVKNYRPWFNQDQLAGQYEVYPGLTYVTLRNSGHFAPKDQPVTSLIMFRQFLVDGSLPNYSG
eukprot:TRINITY_DN1629_c0_g1_i3.p1 TRINITY_DN1629_c0_g1~~TRINITY_DN1629_c0_g1_i3.p1  ORF type:complete len:520 (-),score=77.48 TRINITY_DN1629_c0_g1_i3:195-1754(-)